MSNDIKNLNVDEMVSKFIDQLIEEVEMNKNLEEDISVQLKEDLKERLQNRINVVILSQIPESKLEEFEKLLDAGDEKATQAFCSENIPNLAELIASEFLGFRNRYIS